MYKNKNITRYGCVPLISLILLISITVASAQHSLLFEQFTGTAFPPAGWTRYNFDGGARIWERQTNFYNSSPACAWIKFEPGARVSDDWLVTPRIGPIEATDSLVFYCRAYSPAYSETLYIRFSNNPNPSDTSQYNNITTVYTVITNSTRFQRYSMTLSHHIGDLIYIAFQYTTNNPAPNTKFGIAIDDIAVGFPTPRQDVGATKILAPISTIDSGTVVTPACSVYNYGTYPETYRVRMKIGTFYNDTALVSSHQIGTYKYITFPTWTAIQRGTHTVKCSTELLADVDMDNDVKTGSVYVRVSDVGVTGIIQPAGNVDSTATIIPQAKVKNFGTGSETFDVTFTISGAKWSSTKTVVNLLPNEERTIDFGEWTVGPRGDYTTNCAITLSGDMVPGNNSLNGSFAVCAYSLNISIVGNGTVTKNPDWPSYPRGTQVTLTAYPGTGWHFLNWSGDIISNNNPVIVTMNSDKNITANFGIDSFEIVSSATSGGIISPLGTTIVTYGGNQNYTITPNTGYHIIDVLVDGSSVGAVNSYNFTSVTASHTIHAVFGIDSFTITATSLGAGTISPSGPVVVTYGADQGFIISPNVGYHIDSVVVDGVNIGTPTNYTFYSVTTNHTIVGYFSINTYTITASAVGTGTVNPMGVTTVSHGGGQVYTIIPGTGHHIDSVKVDGVNQGAITNYDFTNVTANHTIIGYFSINTYTITATAYGNGTITPPGVTVVNYGGSQAYTISPNTGYHIDSVKVDGVNQGVITNYNFTSVTTNHTIDAYFSINTYTITATAGPNGSIAPSGAVIVPHGSNQNFIISPDIGYHIIDVLVDGNSVGAIASYTFLNVTDNHTISVSFGIDTFEIISSAGPNGMISPLGTIYVTYNGSQSYTITPDIGHRVFDVLVDGNSVGTVTNYTFNNVTADHTISASFAINTYDLNITVVGNGEVTREPNLPEYNYGTEVTLTALPMTGWTFTGWSGDVVSTDNPIVITMDDDKNITATFTINTYDLNITIVGNGAVTREPNLEEYDYGTQVTLTAIPAVGWTFAGWSGDVVSTDNPIIITMDDDKNITATFTITTYTLTVSTVGSGKVTIYPELPSYAHGAVVTLTAIPDSGWTFGSWSGDATGRANPINVYMDGNKTITATFVMPMWLQKEPIPSHDPKPNKFVKDGGSLVAVSSQKSDGVLYAFRGNKSREFYKYDSIWVQTESIPYGVKPTDSTKINKKKVGKGAALCYDAVNTIYATKGNGTKEFWAYDITTGIWTAKAFVMVPKALKGGTSIAYYDGKVYLLAGGQKKTDPTNFYVYDTETDQWTALNPAPAYDNKPYKDGSCIVQLGDYIYALKGGGKYNYFMRYTIDSPQWVLLDTVPLCYPTALITKPKKAKVKIGGAMTVAYNEIYLIKGGNSTEFWRYTPGTPGVWTAMDTIPKGARGKKGGINSGASLTFCDDTIYLLKGNNSPEFWRYGPILGKSGIQSATITIPEANTNNSLMSTNLRTISSSNPNIYLDLTAQSATIHYTAELSGKVTIKVYDTNGRLVENLNDRYLSSGAYTTTLSLMKFAKGVYFLKYNDITNQTEVKFVVR